MNWPLVVSRVFVGAGFCLVGISNLPLLGFDPRWAYDLYWIATAAGFSLLGLTFWAWLKSLARVDHHVLMPRSLFRFFALACFILGVAYVGLVSNLIQFYRHRVHFGFRWEALSYGLSIAGFIIAAVGFWMATLTSRSQSAAA